MRHPVRSLSLALLLTASLAAPALAEECKKIHGLIVDVQVTEGCTSPNKFCAEGTVKANHGLVGTTSFIMDGVVRGPATAPGSIATSGVLVYTTGRGTLTVRESGLSNLVESGVVHFTAFQQVLAGTGDYEGATGHIWLHGTRFPDHFEAGMDGVLCMP